MAGSVVFAEVGLRLERLADGGPRYAETRLDRTIAEPWNAVTAALFLLLVVAWLVRLRGRFGRFPFLTCCLPILAAGGIGGTFYHAFRTSSVFFWMDVLPIYLLGLATSGYFCFRLRLSGWHVAGVVFVFLLVQAALFPILTPHSAVNSSYGLLAVMLLLPMALILRKTGCRHGSWVALGLAFFGVALFFRWADQNLEWMPMGTHWLWHIFGAAAVAAVTEYVYRLERMDEASVHRQLE